MESLKNNLSLVSALAAIRRRPSFPRPGLFPLTTVVSPSPSDPNAIFDYAWSVDDHLLLAIEFSRPVDTATVVPKSTLIVKTTQDANADGTLQWSADRTQCVFKSVKTAGLLIQPQPDDSFSLTLIGDDQPGRRGIRDEFGLLLDGDYNGREGGTYATSFTIIG